jgi:adenosyl cobinamide kinase/adenosyl cobinamide phosphate guanylyltransferase
MVRMAAMGVSPVGRSGGPGSRDGWGGDYRLDGGSQRATGQGWTALRTSGLHAAMSLHPLTFILGGARSGKSRHAEELVMTQPGPWRYVATGQAFDAEMEERIATHRDRRGPGWLTREAPLDLAGALQDLGSEPQPILVDCLTLWLTNLMLGEHDVAAAVERLDHALDRIRAPVVMVSNEVGLGIVPDNRLARAFRDEAGRLHQRLAARADRVLFMVAGLPMTVKDVQAG